MSELTFAGLGAGSLAVAAWPACVRKAQLTRETVFDETQAGLRVPVVRVAAALAVANAWCMPGEPGRLDGLAALGEELAAASMPELLALLDAPAVAYGKAAIVGTRGELEHGAALLHPQLGKPVRFAIGGGAAVIPSNNKIGPAGSSIDVPLGHKDDPWSFAFIDTLTLSMSDAPREDEIVLFIALASGRRPAARIGVSRDDGKPNAT
jgi:hypothetical protein